MLQAGFARVDITPPLGVSVQGYYEERLADGILDPLYATAVAFDDGERRAVVMSVDVIGIHQYLAEELRTMIAEAVGTVKEAVFLCCTHTHLAPGITAGNDLLENDDYVNFLFRRKLRDAAVLALGDLAPTTMAYTRGKVRDVAFVRRFRMQDGTAMTNPGWQNPEVLHPLDTPDEDSSLLILRRENAPEIGIVNFQVHPDVIGGCSLSADFPKFVRDTYETLIPNSRCMYINGAEGDTNHIDIRLGEGQCRGGYSRAKYMGRKIAMSVLADYELAEPLVGEKIRFCQLHVPARHHKGSPAQQEDALRIARIYREQGAEAAFPHLSGMARTAALAEAVRIEMLLNCPEEKELFVTALAVGDLVFAGFPGEPFTEVGRQVKAGSPFTLTVPACCANGYEDYYPTRSAYAEGGYEAASALFVAGTAETLIAASLDAVNTLYDLGG